MEDLGSVPFGWGPAFLFLSMNSLSNDSKTPLRLPDGTNSLNCKINSVTRERVMVLFR